MPFKKNRLNHWAKVLFYFGTIIFAPALTYGKRVDQSSKPISLDSQNLTHLRDSPMAHGIQESFCTAIKAPHACPECVENFSGAHRYKDALKQSFLLVDSEENGFGGYFILIVFKGHWKVYRLWVYKLSSGEFQLREMTTYMTLNKALMDELSHADYFPYWLNDCKIQTKVRANFEKRPSP